LKWRQPKTLETPMSPLPQRLLDAPQPFEALETKMASPDLRQIASELTLLSETILQRLG
jgi:hypothetical protein